MIETWETIKKSDRQIIDIGYSNHLTGDRNKFEDIGPYKGCYIKFGNDIPCIMKGKGTIQLTKKSSLTMFIG